MINQQDNLTTDQPSSPKAYWAGWLSLGVTLAGVILICMGDPLWLGLPSSAGGVLAGHFALRRGQENQAAAHLGFNLGLLNLFLWLLLIVLMQYVLQMNASSLFEIPIQNAK